MKYYETHFEEYINSLDQIDLHPEMDIYRKCFPQNISQFGNVIIYGSSGIGKYSQMLKLIQKYSPSGLKYDKQMIIQTEKQTYIYKISDIHYEIDMALLGCNSKIVWHEIFSQIVDIVSMKSDKNGIIVCKNFHSIHTELLDIFYSYMQQYNHPQLNIHIKFILITEHLSFLSSRILDNCIIINMKRPSKELYKEYLQFIQDRDISIISSVSSNETSTIIKTPDEKPVNHRSPPPPPPTVNLGQRSSNKRNIAVLENKIVSSVPEKPTTAESLSELFIKQISNLSYQKAQNMNVKSIHNTVKKETKKETVLDNIDSSDILNLKELRTISSVEQSNLPKEVFNNVCDAIIHELMNPDNLIITTFRDILYDILIYNIDAVECVWYIFTHFITLKKIKSEDVSHILDKTYTFLKYYNNNYRPIYHLENIFLLLLTKIH